MSATDVLRQPGIDINVGAAARAAPLLGWHGDCTGFGMAKIRPSLRSSSTYTETNFLRLHSDGADPREGLVTLEHFAYAPPVNGRPGWSCRTIVDGERMSRADAVFIARRYATENNIPVIYEE